MLRVCRHSSNEYGGAMSCIDTYHDADSERVMLANVGH